jgi:AraC-like DNA-binding protein
MKTIGSIPVYSEINECNEATGFRGRTDIPDFHIFTMEETYPETRRAMPPYRRGFYQVTFLEDSDDAVVRLEAEAFKGHENVLFFACPQHVLSWVRGERQRGFIIYFKADFMVDHPRPLEESFRFLSPFGMNVLPLDQVEPAWRASLRSQFEQLHRVFLSGRSYRAQQLAALTLALLYDCRGLYDQQQSLIDREPASSALVYRFEQLVWRSFATHRTVGEYARCLAVSPDHLSATVKARLGKTARDVIAERIVFEAKRLLTYTDLSVSEIADHLLFSEPSHFARFFRRHTKRAPADFRRESAQRLSDTPLLASTA